MNDDDMLAGWEHRAHELVAETVEALGLTSADIDAMTNEQLVDTLSSYLNFRIEMRELEGATR